MKLQVKIGKNWHYVFCRNIALENPVITQSKDKAVRFNKNSLEYFKKYFGSLEFRGA